MCAQQASGMPRTIVASALVVISALSGFFPTVRAEWLEVRDSSLVVPAGSALDFSGWLPGGPAGRLGRVVVGDGGRLSFAKEGGKAAKFHCASLAWSPATGGFPDKSGAELFARQLRIHGYNLVRFHYVEASLMLRRDKDFDFDPEQLDRFYYFLAALKREGIYWLMDIMSSENGAIGDVRPHGWIRKHDLKFRVHVDPVAMAHWKELADRLYARTNPHTGTSVLEDPALAGVVLLNEGGMSYLAVTRKQGWAPELRHLFSEWVRKKYSSDNELAKAWGDLKPGESAQRASVELPGELRRGSLRMADFQRFLTDLESKTAQEMRAHLQARGYTGLATSYNNWVSTQVDATRASLPFVDAHAYHDEATSFAKGTTMLQTSSIPSAARYARWLAVARHAGIPFGVTEYGQPFWNRYRYEASIVVPSMAAFQGWDFACLHAEGTIDISFHQRASRKAAIHPYGVGLDPVTRAGETLAALLFMRGDVSPARSRIRFDYSGDAPYMDSGVGVIPENLSALTWLTGVDIQHKPALQAPPAKVTIRPEVPGIAEFAAVRAALELGAGFASPGIARRVESLRKLGVLDSSNLTNVAAGVYVSDTGQICIDTRQRTFSVVTQRTVARSSTEGGGRAELGPVSIANPSTGALIAMSSLDGQDLTRSRRMLVILASDAENSGMRFSDPERRTLDELGKLPPRILRATVQVALQQTTAQPMRLVSLKLNGERGDEFPVRIESGTLRFALDNGAPSHGPTTFFLLEER